MARTTRRRAHARVPADITVKLSTPDGRAAAAQRISNISLGGVFVEMAEPLDFGTEVRLELTLPGAPRTLRCAGFVVWSTRTHPERAQGRSGVGVRLLDIGAAEMRLLAEYIEHAIEY